MIKTKSSYTDLSHDSPMHAALPIWTATANLWRKNTATENIKNVKEKLHLHSFFHALNSVG